MLTFEWNPEKNRINQRKHGISFEEAIPVFDDINAIVFDDPDHSYDEERFLIIGLSTFSKVCTVSYCYRNEDIIRIISARKANISEAQTYWKYYGGTL